LQGNIDALSLALNKKETELQGNIDALTATVNANKTASEESDSKLQEQIDAMTTDVWIHQFTIPAASFVSDGTHYVYTFTNDALFENSDVEINYADTSIRVAKYTLFDGSLSIHMAIAPASDIVIKTIHIENEATD